jgi:hypothetical protein
MQHNDKLEYLQKRCYFIIVSSVFLGGFCFLVFWFFGFLLFCWGPVLATRFDMLVCRQWIALIIAHCDGLLLLEMSQCHNVYILPFKRISAMDE